MHRDTYVFVKKLKSLNPVKFKLISLAKAVDEYGKYIESVITYKGYGEEKRKTFRSWLNTEI